MYRRKVSEKKKCSPQKRTARCPAKPFGWRASKRFNVKLPHDFTLALGDSEVDDSYPEVYKS